MKNLIKAAPIIIDQISPTPTRGIMGSIVLAQNHPSSKPKNEKNQKVTTDDEQLIEKNQDSGNQQGASEENQVSLTTQTNTQQISQQPDKANTDNTSQYQDTNTKHISSNEWASNNPDSNSALNFLSDTQNIYAYNLYNSNLAFSSHTNQASILLGQEQGTGIYNNSSQMISDISTINYRINFETPGAPFPTTTATFENVESNFFVKAASVLTGFFTTSEKPKGAAVSVAGHGGENTSGFGSGIGGGSPPPSQEPPPQQEPPPSPPPLVELIPHEHASSHSFTIAGSLTGSKIALESGLNSFFFVTQPALQTVNANGATSVINLTGNATGVQAIAYSMRAATALNPVALSAGGNSNVPGTVLLSTLASNLAVPGQIDLAFGANNSFLLLASASVPAEILPKVTVPVQAANAQLIYNFLSTGNPGVFLISDYSPNAHITYIEGVKNIGAFATSGSGSFPTTGVLIQSSINEAVIAYSSAAQKLVFVDANGVIGGRTLFGVASNVGTVIKEGSFNNVKVGYANTDSNSDLLFGSNQMDGAILLYGAIVMPSLIDLAQLPVSIQATKFLMPDSSHIVGTPIGPDVTPLDGGAALNALVAPNHSINFGGDVNGDGTNEMMILRHSTNYAYDSDLLYVVSGQETTFPDHVQLLPYDDPKINQGIIGTGYNASGQAVQDVHGFIITGQLQQNKIIPNSFAATSIGDINGDGYSDLLALSNNNKGYLIFGHPEMGDGSGNLHLGNVSPYVFQLFSIPELATTTAVPTIDDIKGAPLNGDGFSDLLFSSAFALSYLESQSLFSKYLTVFQNSNGDVLGMLLSGAILSDSSFGNAPVGSAYVFQTTPGHYDTSHVILGLNGQSTLEGFTGIDSIIAGLGTQTLIEHGVGAINSHMPGVVGSTLIGNEGDNIFQVADAAFHEVRGDAGFDTLKLNSGTLDLTHVPDSNGADLAAKASHIVSGIERMELGDNTNLIIDPTHLLNINLGLNNSPNTGSTALTVGALNGASQDPNKAPSVTLMNDASHQWIETVQFNGNHSFQLVGITGPGTVSNPMASLTVESNVQAHVASA